MIKEQPRFNIEIKESEGLFGPTMKQNERILYFQADRIITDISLLKSLFDLFGEIMEELNRLGYVSSERPSVQLFKD